VTRPLLSGYLAQLDRLAENLREQLASSERELQRKAREVFEALTASWTTDLADVLASIPAPDFAAQAVELQEAVQRSVISALDDFRKTFDELPPHLRKALLLLGQHGWYLHPDMPMPFIWQLRDMIVRGDIDEAERWMCEYFEAKLDRIEENLVSRFPLRAPIIHAAFSAHRNEEYVLSIPVLFAQTDGICNEVVGQYLFMKTREKPKRPQTAVYVEALAADAFLCALLSPLAQTLPVNAPTWELSRDSGALNRHAVVHGTALDYGTRINGLKAVSLINYVATTLPEGTRDGKEANSECSSGAK